MMGLTMGDGPSEARKPGRSGGDLSRLFDPRSIAIVGASANPAKWGHWLARSALRGRERRAGLRQCLDTLADPGRLGVFERDGLGEKP